MVFDFAAWAVSVIARRNVELAKLLIITLLNIHPNRELAREMINNLPISLGYISAWFLLARIEKNCFDLVFEEPR